MGSPAWYASTGGTPKVVFDFTVSRGKVIKIEMVADEDVLGEMAIEFLSRMS
jgi:hypothetical protein